MCSDIPEVKSTHTHVKHKRMVEAILFATDKPLSSDEIAKRMPEEVSIKEILKTLRAYYENSGIHLVERNGRWAFRTAPDLGFLMQTQTQKTRKLSRAAIETLAIIAYHQPTTRAEIEEIRGVTVSRGTLAHLMDIGWIKLGRRSSRPGRPATFMTTQYFLDHFDLENVKDLPGLKELRQAGLLESYPEKTIKNETTIDDGKMIDNDSQDISEDF